MKRFVQYVGNQSNNVYVLNLFLRGENVIDLASKLLLSACTSMRDV
jgi:hypothetical protein